MRWFGFLALLTLLSPAAPVAPASAAADELRLAAATSLAPLAGDLADTLRRTGLRIQLRTQGSERALQALALGEADVALIARPLSAVEAGRFTSRLVGHDVLLLVVHERNPLDEIAPPLVHGIFSRELTDWQQVGAGNAGPIVPVRRKRDSGARTVIDRGFDIGETIPTGIIELGSNLAAVLYVAADPQAIGYVSAGVIEEARQRGLRVKALRFGGMPLKPQFCVSGQSPLCRPLLVVGRRHAGGEQAVARLTAALGGSDGEQLLGRHGFASLAASR